MVLQKTCISLPRDALCNVYLLFISPSPKFAFSLVGLKCFTWLWKQWFWEKTFKYLEKYDMYFLQRFQHYLPLEKDMTIILINLNHLGHNDALCKLS